ncbi:hypothetical protein Tco_0895189 [Tanacetum coccineum]|uniref:Uncharacterized protein n=1 Tax=Tanacetum coccineum TaxID=301880 RepID=A0ABQ5CFD7_9ASTR
MEIQPVSSSNSTAVMTLVFTSVPVSSRPHAHTQDIFKASIKELKKAMNIQDTLPHALINKIFLKEHQVYDCKQIKLKIFVEGDC